jgi:hypothetical protein
MPLIHVARDGAKLGEFTPEQVRDGFQTGQFRPTDLGWQSGLSEWRPLSEFVAASAPAVPLPVAGIAAGSGLPWENREQIGFFKAFFHTVSLLITRPGEAFTMMRVEGGLMDPLLFGLIGGCAATVVSIFFQVLLESIPNYPSHSEAFNLFGLAPWVMASIYAAVSPVSVLLWLFIGSAILHLCLMLVGGANRSFEATLRVVSYASGAGNLFSMIPVCGWLIAIIYLIVLACIGLTRAHQTTTGKALLAIFLPMFVCCCALVLLFAMLFGSLGAFAEYLNHH